MRPQCSLGLFVSTFGSVCITIICRNFLCIVILSPPPFFFFLCFFPYLLLHLFLLVCLSAKGLTGSSFHSNYPRTYVLLSQVPISLEGPDPGASTPLHPLPLLLACCYVAQTSNERQIYAVVVCPRS